MTTHSIINGDSRTMYELTDQSIHLVITSPPYWQLKDYGTTSQIGFHDTYENYINNLNLVWKECYRILHPGCRLCINIGDQFARAAYYGRYKVIPIRQEIIKCCEFLGFDYLGAIIWQKSTTSNASGGGVQMGSYPYPRNGVIRIDYEFILIFKKPGVAPKPDKSIKEQSIITPEEWNAYFAGHWHFPGARQKSHLAMFPEELPRRLIKMFSFVGETVLDPFAGSGTTLLAAKNLKRNSIGYEINKAFVPIIQEKLKDDQNAADNSIHLHTKGNKKIDFNKEISKLPYIFKDPQQINNKVDIKKFRFGSKIDGNGSTTEEHWFTIKEIISTDKMILNNHQKIKLLGITPKPEQHDEAIAFLENKLKGKQVFLKFDNLQRSDEHHLLCYLYLKNKTFINAHLIKNGFAKPDLTKDFKLKEKFIKLSKK